MKTKKEKRAAVYDALNAAIADLYHAATPAYIRGLSDEMSERYWSFIQFSAEGEFDYLNSGGSCGTVSYDRMTHVKEKAAKMRPETARYFLAQKRREYIRDARYIECRIGAHGKLYTWGRGGRTVAPDSWVKEHGGSSFSMREFSPDDLGYSRAVEMLRDARDFGAYVVAWNRGLPEMFADSLADELSETRERIKGARATVAELRGKVRALAAELKAATVKHGRATCAALRLAVKTMRQQSAAAAKEWRELRAESAQIAESIKAAKAATH